MTLVSGSFYGIYRDSFLAVLVKAGKASINLARLTLSDKVTASSFVTSCDGLLREIKGTS